MGKPITHFKAEVWTKNQHFKTVECAKCVLFKVVDKLTGEVMECSAEVLAKHTCLAHAVVYNRAQGLTIREQTCVLHDMHSKYFRRPHLYVGLSRVTRGVDIRLAD